MFGKNLHIGESNNIKMKKRKINKIHIIVASIILVIIIVVLITTGSLSNLMGNSVVSQYYCEDSSYKLDGDKCVKEIKANPVFLGDINLDNKVSEEDLNLLTEYADLVFEDEQDKSSLSAIQVKVSDINEDGEVYYNDESILREYLSGSISTYGVYFENIGVKRFCEDGYTLKNDYCSKEVIVPALVKENKLNDSNDDIINTPSGSINSGDSNYYKIHYEANGGVGRMSDQSALYGRNNLLKNNLFKRVNYNFLGWNAYDKNNDLWYCYSQNNELNWYKENECSSKYLYKNREKFIETNDNYKTIIMYAQWQADESIDFQYNNITLGNDIYLTKYGTRLKFNYKFMIFGDENLYYRVKKYYGQTKIYESNCEFVNNNQNNEIEISVDHSDSYLSWEIYSDSLCSKKIKSFETKKYNYIKTITLSSISSDIYVGDEITINSTVSSSSSEIIPLTWNSSNPEIASVDKNGKVRALKEGTTTISAMYGDIRDSVVIDVKNDEISIEIANDENGLLLKKDSIIHASHKFEKNSKRDLYYKEEIYSNDKIISSLGCQIIESGKNHSDIMAAKYPNLYIKYNIYSDSSCKNIVKSFYSQKYNYISNIEILNDGEAIYPGSKKTLKIAKIDGSITDVYSKVKWDSLNKEIVTVDENGIITAVASGTAKVVASIGNYSSIIDINVKNVNEIIDCPMIEYDNNGDITTITVNKNSTFSKYDIYLSTNNQSGTRANFELLNSNIKSNSSFTNMYNGKITNQAKIVVYNDSGISRNCYTASFNNEYNNVSTIANCPTFNYSYNYINGSNSYTYKSEGRDVKSGVDKIYVSFNLNNEYQYNWFTLQKDGSYKLFKTYSTLTKNASPSVTGNYYDRNGQVIVTDYYGNSVICKTNYINNNSFNKEVIGGTNVYTEKDFPVSERSNVKNVMLGLYKENNGFLSVSNLFLYNGNTYEKMYGNNSCALYFWDNKIAMNGVDSCGSEYRKGSIKHELGHAIDLMHDKLTNSRLHKYNFGGNSIDSFYIKYSNDLSLKNKYLRKYSYTDSMEFWADLFAYDLKNLKIDNSLSQIRYKAINQYNKVYIENRNKWNAIKEQYK